MLSASEVLQGAYTGAQDAGHRIAGLCKVEYDTVLAGPKEAPIEVGQAVSLTVRQAEDGRLLPRLEDIKPGDPPARWLLKIDVRPGVEFDEGDESRVVWVAHVRRIDVVSGRVVGVGMSGLTRREAQVLQDDRPIHEYLDDPAYQEAIQGAEAADPATAVAQAMGRLTPLPAATPPRRRRNGLIAGGLAVTAAAGIGFVALSGGDATPTPAAASSTVAPPPSEQSTTIDDATATTEATGGAPQTTVVTEPLHIFTTTMLVFAGTQDAVQTWNVADATLVSQETLATPIEFFVMAQTSDGNSTMLALSSPPDCAVEPASDCKWVLEVYEHVGGQQHSSATEIGAIALGIDKTFLADGHDQGTIAEAGAGCTSSMTGGQLPVHPVAADDFGIGVYYPNSADEAFTDTVFVELGAPTEVRVVVVQQGEATAIATATAAATAASCYSWDGTSTGALLDMLGPTMCAAEQVDADLEFCDGEVLEPDRLTELLESVELTPAIEAWLARMGTSTVVVFPDDVGLVAAVLGLLDVTR